MLVLQRNVNERIYIGEPGPNQVVVTVVKISCNERKVRLGVEAPDGIPIHREEVYRKLLASGEPLCKER